MNKYSSYQDTDCDWIGKIPSSWRLVRGRFLFRSQKEINRDMQCENLLSLTYDGVLNKNFSGSEGLRPENYNTYQIFQKDNLVFKMIDLENVKTSRVGIVHEKGIMSSAYIRFEAIKTKIEPKFAYWFYYDLYKKEIYNSIGSGVRSTLSSSDLLEMELPVPQLEEQKLISRYLDKKTEQIDRLVEKIEKKIELLKEQRTALINQCVTKGLDPNVEMKDSGVEWIGEIPKHWDIKKISWVTSLVTQGGNPDYSLGEVSDDFRVLKTKNLYDDKIYYDSADTISEATFLRETQSKPEPNDLLVAIVGKGSIGKVNIFDPPDDRKYIYSRSLGCVRFIKDEINVFYIKWFFNSSSGKQILNLGIGGSTGQEVLKTTYLSGLLVPKPPLTEQKKISYYLKTECSKIDQMVDIETKRSNLLKEYCQSLISSVVTGKVHVTKDML